MSGPAPYRRTGTGVRLNVRVTPKASRTQLAGWIDTADDGRALKIQVTAVPEAGKANKAVIALLSKTLRLPKSAFGVISGANDRNKTIEITGSPDRIADLLEKDIPA